MTPQQIRDAIAGNVDLQNHVAVGNMQAIADALSVGRTKLVPTEVGNGTILEILGITAGNALLDVINTAPDFRYVKPLVEQGRLRLDSTLVINTMQSLVGTVLTQPQADALLAKATVPAPITAWDVSSAIYNDNGSLKV